MDEVGRGELGALLMSWFYANLYHDDNKPERFNAIVRWVEARELEAYERAASTQARLMACAPKGGL